MASVTSLDHDMRRLRLDRYTPGAANEIRAWIETMLGEKLAPGDLMEALRDGVALCRLVNLAVSPGVKYKQSNMPFVQMENISHFLRACEAPPLNLPSHDRFLTVDLFDGKDPAQVLQCIAAFSRRANEVNPSAFPHALGGKSKGSSMSPQGTGSNAGTRSPAYTTTSNRPRGASNTSDSGPHTFSPLNTSSSGRTSPTKSSLSRGGLATGGPVSSWSKPGDEHKTAPAWNIHQYGYMGGASQGNMGVAFGARRQLTSQGPDVPSLAEKEKRLREKIELEKREAEENRLRQQAELEAEEERIRFNEEQARIAEETRWQEETRRLREKEEHNRQMEKESRRRREEQAAEDRRKEEQMAMNRSRQRTTSDARLNGQFLSQYKAEQSRATAPAADQPSSESARIKELERQLEEMKAQQRQAAATNSPPPVLPTRSQAPPASHEDDWDSSERDYLRKEWQTQQTQPADDYAPPKPPRPTPAEPVQSDRPLPNPSNYAAGTNRTDRYLSSNPAPSSAQPASHRPTDYSTTTEVDLENQRRAASQAKTKAGGWASKSLLEREMERERERQREWEESQKATVVAARDQTEGSGPGQSWDVHQYGYMGGDSQNRGGPGLGVGGARRQIIGPRPPP